MARPEMKRALSVRVLVHAAMVVASLVPCAAPCWAGVSYDVSVGLPIGDDAKLFLNVTNEYYAPPEEVATVLVQRCPHPEDDYPTVLFLAHASGRPPGEILDLRLRGQSWADIMFGLRLSPSILFVGLDRDPGPPYGRAWGYWRRHPRERLAIEDREFVEYTKLQVAAGYYHVRPWEVAAERQRGVSVERFAAERHRGRGEKGQEHHGRGLRHEDRDDEDEQHGHRGHGHPHGDRPEGD